MHACMYACMYVCICMYIPGERACVCMCVCTHVCAYLCVCVYIYIHMHACVQFYLVIKGYVSWATRGPVAKFLGPKEEEGYVGNLQNPESQLLSLPKPGSASFRLETRAQASPWSLRLVQVELAPANWKTLSRAFKVGHVAGDIPFLLVEPKAWKPEKDYFYSYSFLVILIFVCLLLLRSRCHCHDLQAGVPRKTPKLSQNGMRGRLI